MKQRDFSFQSIDDAVAAVPAIADYVHATTYADALIMMFVKWVEEEDAQRLLVERFHGAQQRRLFVQRVAAVRAERRGDAERIALDERI